jgi:O-methyltransferase domain/Dimerisation domain
MSDQLPPLSPAVQMMRLINGYQVSQALHVAATLGIADLLRDGPRSSDALADIVGADRDALYRLLRALAAVDVFHEDTDRVFSLTELGACLRSDAPQPVGPWAAFTGRPYYWQVWSHLLYSVRTGKYAFPYVHGVSNWEYRAGHPDESTIFDAAMTAITRGVTEVVVAAYDFSPFVRIVDVGGGQGLLLGSVLAANAHLRGVLFDQPHVVSQADEPLREMGVRERCEITGGDFFGSVPAGDLHMLKSVLHDWNDEQALAILRSCRAAVTPGGRVLVLERIIGAPNIAPAEKFGDLNMLVAAGRREGSHEEFVELFAAAGYALKRALPTGTQLHLIEGTCI